MITDLLLIFVGLIAFAALKRGNRLDRELNNVIVRFSKELDKLREEFKKKMSDQNEVLTGFETDVTAIQQELVAHTTAISAIEQALATEIATAAQNNTPLDPARIAAIHQSLVGVVTGLQAQDSAIALAVAAVPTTATPAPVVTPAPVEAPAPAPVDPTPVDAAVPAAS